MSYKVQFLDDKEFEALPIPDLETKVGFAHRPSKTAYVRKIAPVVDVFSAMHELEHLENGHFGEHPEHYDAEHDIYYKSFGDVLTNILPAVGGFFTGGPIGGILGGLGSFANNQVQSSQQKQQAQMMSQMAPPQVSQAPKLSQPNVVQGGMGTAAPMGAGGGAIQKLLPSFQDPTQNDPYAKFGRMAGR